MDHHHTAQWVTQAFTQADRAVNSTNQILAMRTAVAMVTAVRTLISMTWAMRKSPLARIWEELSMILPKEYQSTRSFIQENDELLTLSGKYLIRE